MIVSKQMNAILDAVELMKELEQNEKWILISPDGTAYKSADTLKLIKVLFENSAAYKSITNHHINRQGEI